MKYNTFDRTVFDLCLKIDNLKEEVDYWKQKYENERNENMNNINENLERSKQGIARALMFALHVKDDENGNLIIDKEDRKVLAEQFK